MLKKAVKTFNNIVASLVCLALCLSGVGCSLPSSGPNMSSVMKADASKTMQGIVVVPLNDEIARDVSKRLDKPTLAEVFGKDKRLDCIVAPGDSVQVTVWETPPAILFGTVVAEGALGELSMHAETLPAQMVMEDGNINMPFAGMVKVAGRSLRHIEREIASRLEGKANNPQVMARVTGSPSSQVAVIGDVRNSANIPLTPKGERVLDALASAGGVTQPVTRVSMQLSRKGVTATSPLDAIMKDPKQNVYLRPGDVLAAMFQPWTFSALGATGANKEIPFEAEGISLAQAIARSGGLNDNRADPAGVFVFRFEQPVVFGKGSKALEAVREKKTDGVEGGKSDGGAIPSGKSVAKEEKSSNLNAINGKIPTVYSVDFSDPSALFATQNFKMRDKDIIFVANASSNELAKFLRMIGLVVSPFTTGLGIYTNIDRLSGD